MRIALEEVILRTELEADPVVLGPWPVGLPAYVVFIENDGDVDAEVHIKGGQDHDGPFVRSYGSDSLISVPARAKAVPAVITDIPKFLALHLESAVPNGVKITIATYQPRVDQELARESLVV